MFKIILEDVIFGSQNRGCIFLERVEGAAWLACEIGRSGSCPHSIRELLYSVFLKCRHKIFGRVFHAHCSVGLLPASRDAGLDAQQGGPG